MKKTITVGLALFTAVMVLPTLAAAEEKKEGRGYGYEFKDDLLTTTAGGAAGAQIQVRPYRIRERLMRPRLQFVTEMVKSVENL
jgi:hypothetical protein